MDCNSSKPKQFKIENNNEVVIDKFLYLRRWRRYDNLVYKTSIRRYPIRRPLGKQESCWCDLLTTKKIMSQ